MLNFLMQLIPTAIILGFLIFIHEFGHYLACLWSGVRVEKFSIGFGPEIIKWTRQETVYAISLIPFGGFVKPAGESFAELEGRAPAAGDFLAAPKVKRLIILAAGVLMNYVVAFVLFVFVFWTGHPVLKAKIGGFVSGFPAEASDLKVGDEVISINGKLVKDWQEMTMSIFENKKSDLTLGVRRENHDLQVVIKPKTSEGTNVFGEKKQISRIGVMPANEYGFEKYNLAESIQNSFLTTANLAVMTYKSLWYLVTGRMSVKTLSGPIGIMVMTGNAARAGISALLQLTAVISISLAVINLLPIPALDGGHIFFLLIGAIFRRDVSAKVQDRVTQVGFTLLMALMVFVVYNDLVNLGFFNKIKAIFGG